MLYSVQHTRCVCWPKSTETETETETEIGRCANSAPSWLYAYISLLQYVVEFMFCFFSLIKIKCAHKLKTTKKADTHIQS